MTAELLPTGAGRARPLDRGILAWLVATTAIGVLAIGLLPTLLQEGTRDWIAYQQAADRLVAGEPLYVFDLATPDDEYYLYPPFTAALWAAGGTPELLLATKIAVLALLGGLATVLAPDRRGLALVGSGGALVATALISPPVIHDIVLANVMAFYVGAVAWSLARPGWAGAIPLGLVCAAALKPVVGPYLLWLLIRRRRDLATTLAVGLAASAACALVIGPGRYVEYLVALPRMSVLADLPSGNVGLSAISREAALVGVVLAYGVTVAASIGRGIWGSAALAIAAGLLAQPSIGFNYAGLLIPAVAALWLADRRGGFAACAVVPVLALLSVPLAAAGVVVIALLGGWPRQGTAPEPA